MALHKNLPIPPIVSLRRYGDIINLLPLLRFLAQKQNAPVKLVVHRSFSPVLDGVSYVEPIIWDGDMDDPMPAARAHKGVNAQVHGKRLKPDRSGINNFARLAWRQLGYEWDRHTPLIFDKRDEKRERDLVGNSELPIVAVKMGGFSSPFTERDRLWNLLRAEFGGLCELIDMDKINAERIYDLLGVLDRSACLISVDTAPLWMARGSRCPVIALTNDVPFLASPPVGNVLLRIPYRDIFRRWSEITATIYSTLFDLGSDGIVHVFQDFGLVGSPEAKRRNDAARSTWNNLEARLFPFQPKRSSKDLRDPLGVPFIRDMVNAALSSGSERIIVISNNDVKLDPALKKAVIESCQRTGCYWAYRVPAPGQPTDHGADFFAFTRAWWFQHQHLYPDMLLGYYWWDDLFVRMMRWSGCLERERLYYHEPHAGGGPARLTAPGHRHNEQLALAWLGVHHELNQKPQ